MADKERAWEDELSRRVDGVQEGRTRAGRSRGDDGYELTFEHGYGAWDAVREREGGAWGRVEAWMREGEHTGRGPKGYRRADERILEDANDRLTLHGAVDASDITVSVEKGEITLEGTVESRRVKRIAEDALESIPGVLDIHNRLRLAKND